MVTSRDIDAEWRKYVGSLGTKHEQTRREIYMALVEQAKREHAERAVRP